MSMGPVNILVIEDNPGDADLTLEALSNNEEVNTVQIVEDGEQALDYLYKRGNYSNAITPDLIFLDLNLPKKDGREILSDIKTNQKLKIIPVIMLTSSESETDIAQSYDLNANAYITKPIDLKDFFAVIETTRNFWLNIARLPSKDKRKA